MPLILITLLPFLGALLPALMIRAGRDACAASAGVVTAAAFIGLLAHAPDVFSGTPVAEQYAWLPMLGLNASFLLDGLSFLFASLILGIGLLIILYARFYLGREDPAGQFYTYLLLFQGAMVGIVLSGNVLLLIVFWELTSLSSFLLIGYWKHLPEGRQGARMALAVTGAGGLALIGGMLIIGEIAGSYEIAVILQSAEQIQASPLYLPALILILIGAFTKSAQFPFHFWLPHAMAAPTPVSAYLHSATMVKAGLFLMARLWPALAGTDAWFYIVTTAGLVTMLIGAVIALFKDDLKALLAFSTVSHLGLITMLLGFGTPFAAVAAVFHIINHAIFKAALFMVAGIVDHEAHTRDIRRLGGLMRLMPLTFAIALVTALSMAGVPLLNGFLSKEMMLEEAGRTAWAGNGWLIPALATLGSVFSVAYSLRLLLQTFTGRVRGDYPARPHDPGAGLWAAPALLACLAVIIGILPAAVAGGLVATASQAVIGGPLPAYSLKIWHGFTPALYMSMMALAGGALLFLAYPRVAAIWARSPVPDAKSIFDRIVAAAVRLARFLTDGLHNGAMTRYATVFMVTVAVAGAVAWFGGTPPAATSRSLLPITPVPAVGWLLLVVATASVVIFHRHRFLALILIGVNGLVVSITFAYFSAPDLALTQATVEVVTIILLLLALNFLPKHSPRESGLASPLGAGAIAVAVGLGAGLLTYAVQISDFAAPSISAYHVENSKPGGGGTNIVNVILVDFRGFDTFGEIIVLGIAALVIYALTESILAGPAGRRLRNRPPDVGESADRHPLMMVVATRVMMPLAIMVGAYIFLRGHNSPGGGFIAGLIVAIALIMQYMASGFDWATARQRFPYHGIIAYGVFAALLTGVGSFFADRPFLTSNYGYFKLPFIEEFELATAMAFDLGVFLCVVGAVMLALESLSRLAHRSGEKPNVHAMDVDPSRANLAEKT